MNVRLLRLQNGYTVPKLSELSGLPVRTIENVEKRGECTVSTAKKLARALNVTLDELCDFNASGERVSKAEG